MYFQGTDTQPHKGHAVYLRQWGTLRPVFPIYNEDITKFLVKGR